MRKHKYINILLGAIFGLSCFKKESRLQEVHCNSNTAKIIFEKKLDTLDYKLWSKLSDTIISERVLKEVESITNIKAPKQIIEFYGEVGSELLYIPKWKKWLKENKKNLCYDPITKKIYTNKKINKKQDVSK